MPDYMFLLESRLSPEQRAALVRVQELARAQDSNVYLTGGAVRDLISGMPIRDLDFTIEGNPQRIVRELEKGGARAVSKMSDCGITRWCLPEMRTAQSRPRATKCTSGPAPSRKFAGPR